MTLYDLANGCALGLAVVCAFHLPPRERAAGLALVGVFAVNWLHFVCSYLPTPPVALLWRYGLMVESQHVWELLDALTAMAGIWAWVATRAWWGPAIYALHLTMLVCHALYWDFGVLSAGAYFGGLDKLFLAAVAVFILAGGKGVGDRIGGYAPVAWLRRAAGAGRASAAKLVARP